MADNSSVIENIKKNIKDLQDSKTIFLSDIAGNDPNLARRIQAAINDIDSIKIEDAEEVERLIFDKKLSGLLRSKEQFYQYGRHASYIPTISNSTSDLEQSISAIKKTLDVDATLSRAKEALDDMQKTTTIKFSNDLSKEYGKLENKYFWTGVAWQLAAVVSFICIFCVLFHHQAEIPKTIIDTNSSIGGSFVFSVYALNPVFAKIGLIVFFGAMAGVCLKIYSEYKRLSQEYRQKSLLAKNLLTGHDVLKPYIGDKIDTAFILPTIEKMLEDPLTKVYSNKDSKEDALGLVEKIIELGKKGKELGGEKV